MIPKREKFDSARERGDCCWSTIVEKVRDWEGMRSKTYTRGSHYMRPETVFIL